MSKLLLIGLGPLFEKGVRNFGGQCLRTWCFAKPLIDDGHQVLLITLPIYDPNDPAMHQAGLVRRQKDGLEYFAFTNLDFAFVQEHLLEVARSFKPDAIFAINSLPAWIASQLPLRVPLWTDLFGYEMAEKQGRAAWTGDTKALLRAWQVESLVARRADKLSTVSRPQLHALLGEMAGLGRLNQHTFHYHFAHHVPIAYHPVFSGEETLESDDAEAANSGAILRGRVVPEDAFIVLWSGGYNYWTDPQFLFALLETLMTADPRIHYVSTGGAIEGYNTQTYEQFVGRIQTSSFRDRCHLLGWVPAEQLPGMYREADVGLNIDEPNYETLFGGRNRINNMMAAGLPVVTTRGSEVSQMIAEADCGIVCPPGSVADIVAGILEMLRSPDRQRDLARRSREYALNAFSPHRLTAPALEWARKPSLAPDNEEKLRRFPRTTSFLDCSTNYLEEAARIVEQCDVVQMRKAQVRLEALRARPLYRTVRYLKRVFIGKSR
jgi:glycosyltransferase involved in cell wall biosynthesis